jgi:hypothetical protein
MELQTSQVDLDSIEVKGDFPTPDPEQVTYLAHAITTVGGLIQVPVVRQLDLETYELVHGYFEYQAYLKAREINPELPDRMRVFVITKKNEDAIQQQLEVFETLSGGVDNPTNGSGAVSPDLAIKLNNLVSAVELLQKDVKTTAADNQQAILGAIDERIPKPIAPLDAFNRIDEPQIAQEVLKKLTAVLRESKAQDIVANLQTYHKQQPDHPLSSFGEVIEAVGKDRRGRRYLTENTMLKVIDQWNR